MNRFYFFSVLVLALSAINYVNGAVARMEVELGKEARFDFGKDMILIKRTTSSSPEAQYLFASPGQDGTWTTDGHDKIPSTAYLHWNGTLTFKTITKTDLGSYEMPLELPRPHVARSMIDFVEKTN